MAVSKVVLNGTTLIDLTSDTVDVSYIVLEKTAHKNDGTSVTGNVATQAAQTITPTTTDQTIASGKYLTGVQTIKGDANLIAENIKEGVSIFGVTGTHAGGGGGTTKTVEISLGYPSSPSAFESFTIFETINGVKGDQIGSISSASGSTTVTVSAAGNGIICELESSGWISINTDIAYSGCLGGVGLNSYSTDSSSIYCSYIVSYDGRLELNFIEWDD